MDETMELKALKKEFSDTFKDIITISRMKINNKSLDSFDGIVKRIPQGQTLGTRVEELRKKSLDKIKEMQKTRVESYKKVISKFVNTAMENNSYVKQSYNGWRIDQFEYVIKEEIAKISIQYNKEIIIPWTSIGSSETLDQLKNKALGLLKKYEIEFDDIINAFREAIRETNRRRKQTNLSSESPLPILDFIREFRVALIRNQLTVNFNKKLKYADLPGWAILYNFDRYKANITQVPEDIRFIFSVSNQGTQQKGEAILLGGLDKKDYVYYSGIKSLTP
jgi:hypothetical protein